MPSPRPRAAVVITCFNDGATLEDTIASIKQEPTPNIELVVVDDGSTEDTTNRLLARLHEEGERVIRQDNQVHQRLQ